MCIQKSYPRIAALLMVVAVVFAPAGPAMAHCDSLDGPVIAAAQKALAEKDVTPVLKWIPADDEAEVRRAFDMALAIRGESDTAKTVGDNYFFETVVRVHRLSEGAGFTGIKPEGSMAASIAAADRALETGKVDKLANDLSKAIREQIHERFATAHNKLKSADNSVEEGRDYVESYVQFTHFIEAVDHLLSEGITHTHDGAHGH